MARIFLHSLLCYRGCKVQVFYTRQKSTVSRMMRLYFPVDLTGNMITIEKLFLGGI